MTLSKKRKKAIITQSNRQNNSNKIKDLKQKKTLLTKSGSVLLSHVLRRSTIGAERFHFCVRNGNRWFTLAIATRLSKQGLIVFNTHNTEQYTDCVSDNFE